LDAELAALYRQFKRQALHAAEMGFIHPRSKEMVRFKAEYPTDLKELHKALSKLNIASSR
jgi:23S rRNA pseudouridine1911/1915/1917 synthase